MCLFVPLSFCITLASMTPQLMSIKTKVDRSDARCFEGRGGGRALGWWFIKKKEKKKRTEWKKGAAEVKRWQGIQDAFKGD